LTLNQQAFCRTAHPLLLDMGQLMAKEPIATVCLWGEAPACKADVASHGKGFCSKAFG
jgi:hypothetical protein